MRYLAAVLLVLAALPALARTTPHPEEILAQEALFWNNYSTGDTAAMASQFAPEFVSVEEKIWDRSQVLSFVQLFSSKCSLAPVKLVDPRVSFITPEIATIVYQTTEAPTCTSGTTMSCDVNISSMWVYRNGHWQMHLHTEYPLRPGSKY